MNGLIYFYELAFGKIGGLHGDMLGDLTMTMSGNLTRFI